ncbi:MAG: EAL domain-containing protein [Pseudomonadota bacterium]
MKRAVPSVLVLDDDEDDAFLICDTIEDIKNSSYDVAVSHAPTQAFEMMREKHFDVVLCDYIMGATTGIDFIKKIRSVDMDVPVVLLTGLGDDMSADLAALEAGAADFLSKANLEPDLIDRAIRYAIANGERQRLVQTVLRTVKAAVVVVDKDHLPQLWNPMYDKLARTYSKGQKITDAIEYLTTDLFDDRTSYEIGDRIVDKKISEMPDEGAVITLHDVTEHIHALRERQKAENRAAHLAMHCSLTGLPNRHAFSERISKEMEVADAEGSEFYLLNLDLNKFKEVNDVYGHHIGDELLVEVSRLLASCCEGNDYVARLGGDEFVAIQRRQPGQGEVPDLARRISDYVSGSFELGGNLVRTSVSIGVSIYPQHGMSVPELLSNADIAMYRAKSSPNNRVMAYNSELDQIIRERRLLANDLKVAIEHDEIDIAFQPQADIQTGDLVGFEALARWTHPTLGPISPSTFIPIAEENGLITKIGENVLRKACEYAVGWPKDLNVSVNISAVQIRHTDLASIVHTVLFKTGLRASRLELEVTESILIEDTELALHVLRNIKSLGVSLAMDDFGTGYSSLSSLVTFPFDKIKIDRSFVEKVDTSPQAAEIVRAIVNLGHNLNHELIAEGVQNSAHVELLAEEGCQVMQGFLIGKPMINDEIRYILGDRRTPELVQVCA